MMIALLLVVPVLFPSRAACEVRLGEPARVVHPGDAGAEGLHLPPTPLRSFIGYTVVYTRNHLPAGCAGLMIRDPVTGVDSPPLPSDDQRRIRNQDPPPGTPSDQLPAGYYIAVILDPGGEGGALLRIEFVSWLSLFLLVWITKTLLKIKATVPIKPVPPPKD